MKATLLCIACLWAGLACAQPNASERKFIHNGMSEADVVQKIGKPSHKGGASKRAGRRNGQQSATVWTYFPAPDDPQTTTVVTLSNGQVVNVERRVTY